MNVELIKAELDRVAESIPHEIWQSLPDIASGTEWTDFIADTAQRMTDYIYDENKTLEDILDFGNEFADDQCVDTYAGTNKQVQELSLWASNDLDSAVEELSEGFKSLTRVNTLYLYEASRWTWGAVARYVFNKVTELEEVNA